jgi:hypothetical protein
MGFATHLGPWLLGTIKNTTGTTVGSLENLGATVCSQSTKVSYANIATGTATNLFTLPAGAQIIAFYIDTLTALSGNSITTATVVVGTAATTNLFVPSTSFISVGRLAPTLASTQLNAYCGAATTASPNGAGIGATDVIVQAVNTVDATPTAGIVQFTCLYVVADSSGAQLPNASQA